MPIFNYQCKVEKCSHVWEHLQLNSNDTPDACEVCGSVDFEKLLSKPAPPQFQGVGWARDGYLSSTNVQSSTQETGNGSTVTVRKHEGTPPS